MPWAVEGTGTLPAAPPAGPPTYTVLNPQGTVTGITTDPSLLPTQPGATLGPQLTAPPPGAPPSPPVLGTKPGETAKPTEGGEGKPSPWKVEGTGTLPPAPGEAPAAPTGPSGPPAAAAAPPVSPPPLPPPGPAAAAPAPGYTPVPFMPPGQAQMGTPAPQEAAPAIPPPMPLRPMVPQAPPPQQFQPPGQAQMGPRAAPPPLVPPQLTPQQAPAWVRSGDINLPDFLPRGVELGLQKFAEGVPLAGASIADLANLALRQVNLGFMSPGAASRAVEQAYVNAGGLQPQSSGEQLLGDIASAVGGVLPTLGLGAGLQAARVAAPVARALLATPGLQFAGAAGGGAAGSMAQQMGVGAGGQFAAALLGTLVGHGAGGLARGVPAMVRMGTTSGRQAAAGELLLRQSGMDPAAFRARLQAYQPGAVPETTAMATQAPGLMRMEKAIRATPGGAAITEVEAQRAHATGQILQNLRRGVPMTAEERGQALRYLFGEQDDAMRTRADQLYETAKAVKGDFPTEKALRGVSKAVSDYYGPGSGGPPPPFVRIARQILDRPQVASAEWLRNMDRQIGNAARQARMSGDNVLASALGDLRAGVGSINPTQEMKDANAFYAKYKSLTGRDPTGAAATARILRTDKFGNPTMQDARVLAEAIKDPASVRQVLEMADEAIRAAQASGAPAARVARLVVAKDTAKELMREHFLDKAERTALTGQVVDASGTAHPVYSPAAWGKLWRDNKAVADQIFSKGDQVRLQELTDILQDNANAAQTAKAPGSDTAQNLAMIAGRGSPATAHVLGAITGGSGQTGPVTELLARAITTAAGAHLFGAAGAFVAHGFGRDVVEALRGHSDEMIRAMLHEAAADPEVAKLLVSKVSQATMTKLLQRSQQRGGMIWGTLRLLGRGIVKGVAPAAAGTAVQYPRFPY